MAISVPMGKPGKIAKAAVSPGAPKIKALQPAKNVGHQKQTTTPVKSDRGSFGIKG